MGDVDRLISLVSGEHLDFSSAQPSDELWDDSLACAEGDSVSHVTQVWFKSSRDVNSPQSSLEAGNFEAVSDELVVELLLPSAAGVKLLAGGQGLAVYGGDEPIGNGVDRLVDVRVCA